MGEATTARTAPSKWQSACWRLRAGSSFADTSRYVITKRDRDVFNDQRVITVEKYDPLGRLRLTQQQENAQTATPDEAAGIKVQHRYVALCANATVTERSCRLDSNPYRESETVTGSLADTLGWTVRYADKAGRAVKTDTFAGPGLPAAWTGGAASASLGASKIEYGAHLSTETTPLGRKLTTTTDEGGKKRTLWTDALGRLVQVTESPDGLNYQTYYRYDSLDDLIGVCQGAAFDGSGACLDTWAVGRTFQYNSLKRLTRAVNPERGTVNYDDYDNNGNLRHWSDDRVHSGGVHYSATMTYDALNRILSKDYSQNTVAPPVVTPSVTFCYDNSVAGNCAGGPTTAANAIGRLTMVKNTSSETHYLAYDALGRVARSRQHTGTDYTFDYQWSPGGQLAWMKYPSGREVVTTLDDAGRNKSVAKRENGVETNYFAVSGFAAHGGVRNASFGPASQLTEARGYTSRLQSETIGYSNGAGSQLSLTNYYCATGMPVPCGTNNGNVMRQGILMPGFASAIAQTFGYDEVNRLTGVAETGTGITGWSQTYEHDPFGNRAVTASTTALTSLTPSATTQYNRTNRWVPSWVGYDLAGNQTADDGSRAFTYDHENRMVSATEPNMDPISYKYDGDGRRVTKTVGTASTVFVYNGQGELMAEYPSVAPTDTGLRYVATHALGSTRLVADGTGAVQNRYDYYPFGEEILKGQRAENAAFPGTGYPSLVVKAVPQEFTGQLRDAETGLDYFGARYMSSAQGRFTSPDKPFADQHPLDPQSWNLYSYARNNPLRFLDPDGEAVVESRKVQTYQVQGRTASEAFANARQVSGFKSDSGETMSGLTSGRVGIVNMRIQDSVQPGTTGVVDSFAASELVSADVKLDQTITLPEWSGRAEATAAEQARWDAGLAGLRQHEDQHAVINRQQVEKLDKSLPGTRGFGRAPAPGDAQRKARSDLSSGVQQKLQRNVEDTGKRQRKMDDDTDHGRRQP